jgi:hypothetical protein
LIITSILNPRHNFLSLYEAEGLPHVQHASKEVIYSGANTGITLLPITLQQPTELASEIVFLTFHLIALRKSWSRSFITLKKGASFDSSEEELALHLIALKEELVQILYSSEEGSSIIFDSSEEELVLIVRSSKEESLGVGPDCLKL